MSTVMIPASAISATLSADLSYNPNIHVQTVEIDRTSTSLVTEYINNYIKWYMSKVSFANMLRVVPGQVDVSNQIFTIDASQGRLFADASAAIMKYSTSKTYTIPLHSPLVQYGTDSDLSFSDRYGYVGDISVNYERISLESDASTATIPHTTLTTWSFVNTSLNITINWNADASNVISVTANAGSNLEVSKPHNDAAADFIQIKMEGETFDPHGQTNSSADIVSATTDYASSFDSHTGGGVEIVAGVPTLTISDLTLTKALQQAINADGTARDISNDDSLRSVTKKMIELRYLNGFQSAATIDGTLRTTIAGQYATSNDISFSVNPIIFFRYREPTRFALAETDPYGAGQDGTVLYNSIYVAGIDSSGNVDNVDNIDDGALTASLETYDGTTMTADSYEVIGVKHSLFEDPNTVGYSDSSYNTFFYKINFPSQFYLYNEGAARSKDLSAVVVNGISLKVGREKSNLTELYPPTDVSYIYIITQALTQAIEITPIPAVTAEVAMATQTSTRGIMSFTGGYDLRITDQYAGATVGVHKVCLYKTTEGVEALVSNAIGLTTIEANSLNKYSFVNSVGDTTFSVWVNGEKQWNVSSTDVANKADLGAIDKLGTTFLNPPENRVSGTMQDLKVFDTPLTDSQIEDANLPKPSISWKMSSSKPEVGTIRLKSGASLGTLSFKKSKPVQPKPPSFSHSSTSSAAYTVGYANITKTYTFNSLLKTYVIDASFASTDGTHIGSTTFSSSGKTGTISFPTTTNTSGYTVSNVKLRNTSTGVIIDMSDSTHGMTILSSKLWVPPTTSTVSASTQSSLPSPYLLVLNKQCSLRCSFTGGTTFQTTAATDILHSLEYSTNGGSSYSSLSVETVVTAVSNVNKTVDFNFIATNTNEHMFRMKLKGSDGVATSYYTLVVPASGVFTYPAISSTAKLAPLDTITVGQPLSMESTFDETIDANITAGIVVSDGSGGTPSISSQSVSGTKYSYSFVVANDADHSATMTFTFGSTTNTYSWNAAGLLTAANDIYTFPNIVTYDGTSNGYGVDKHLMEDTSSNLVLTFAGGDQLHSDTYGSQVSIVQYKTGSAGSLVTVPSSDVTINSATGHETITLANVIAAEVEDVHFYVTLKGPDGTIMGSPMSITVPSSEVKEIPGFRYIKLLLHEIANPTYTEINHIRFYDISDGTVATKITTNPYDNSVPASFDANNFNVNTSDPYPSDLSKVNLITRGTRTGIDEWKVFHNVNTTIAWSTNSQRLQNSNNETHTVSHRGTNKLSTEVVVDFTNLIDPKYMAIGGVYNPPQYMWKTRAYHDYRMYAQVSKDAIKWDPKYLTWDDSKKSTESNGFLYNVYDNPSTNNGVFKIEDNYNPLFNINRLTFSLADTVGIERIRHMRIFGKKLDNTEDETYALDISNTIGRLPQVSPSTDFDFSWNDISEQYKAYRFEMEVDDYNNQMPQIRNLKIYKTNGNVGGHTEITSNYNNPHLPLLWWRDNNSQPPVDTSSILNASSWESWNNGVNSTPTNYKPSLYID